jgi:hypothetical protein
MEVLIIVMSPHVQRVYLWMSAFSIIIGFLNYRIRRASVTEAKPLRRCRIFCIWTTLRISSEA